MGYKQPFTFLPGEILSSTGLEFNYTYSKSKSNNNDIEGNALPLPSNSEHQSNLILWYDRDGLNLRLAYNWRSEEYLGRVGLNTNAAELNLGNWLEATGYLDFSANYWVNDHLEFSFNGANLTGQNRRSYAQMADQFQSLWVQERRYTLGMTVKL
jgi:TonB-dependent receptor